VIDMRTLKHRFVAFLRQEDGLVLVEGLLMMPLVVWALVAMFIYWDVFRTINVTQKAAYSVADLLSRQKDQISTTFLNGLQDVVDFLTPGGHPVAVRITSLQCNAPTGAGVCNSSAGSYTMLFSASPDNKVAALTEAQIQPWKGTRVATLSHGESVYVVETQVDFKAQLQTVLMGLLVGVQDQSFGEFIVTRPRHRRLCLQGSATCT
jgi:Flp pilus assembly protein TadG